MCGQPQGGSLEGWEEAEDLAAQLGGLRPQTPAHLYSRHPCPSLFLSSTQLEGTGTQSCLCSPKSSSQLCPQLPVTMESFHPVPPFPHLCLNCFHKAFQTWAPLPASCI